METSPSVKEFFAHRITGLYNRHLSSVDFGLIHHITGQHEFPSVEKLLRFCGDPRNLSGFLPDPRDRAVFSQRLVDGLSEFRKVRSTTARPPDELRGGCGPASA